MIFAVFDPWLLTQYINCSFYHLFDIKLVVFCPVTPELTQLSCVQYMTMSTCLLGGDTTMPDRLYARLCHAFLVFSSALIWLVGWQEGHPDCKKLSGGVLGCWHGYRLGPC